MADRQRLRARDIGVAGAALIGSSLVGGVISVLAGANSWLNAWTAEATLAAPWPMLLVQTAATIAATRPRQGLALAGTVVLGLSAAVAGISGFFDGQLARFGLSPWLVAGQIGYVLVAWATVVIAVRWLWGLRSEQRAAGL